MWVINLIGPHQTVLKRASLTQSHASGLIIFNVDSIA